ncbi:MAG: rRNA maturation RNase YbeY [SAR324 cluster bacterium]|nr:rRNA maturation RNase YbeY [SAR324 cluster bacterium]
MEGLIITYGDGIQTLPAQFQEKLLSAFSHFLEVAKFETTVGLHFVGSAEMQRLNLEYRDKDKPTDILSFTYGKGEEQLGDLALCLEVAEAQATQNEWDTQTEVVRLMAHGFTHLLGYDHETSEEEREMIEVEIRLLKSCGLIDIYPQE